MAEATKTYDVTAMHTRYMDEDVSLRQLGEEVGLTYERVRQLFKEHGLPTHKRRNGTHNNAKAWARKEEIFDLYREIGTVEGVAEKIGLPRHHVAPVLADMDLRELFRRRGASPSYDHSYIKSCLKKAAAICGEPLTIPAYRDIAPEEKLPADLTVIRAYGTWEAACKAAGVKANPAEGPRRGSITSDECIRAIRLCAAHLDRVPSYELYSNWARENNLPSGPTVRVKVGPWSEALLLAFSEQAAS